jgi:pimeloyl-ACP methyl ester carboxylesterase
VAWTTDEMRVAGSLLRVRKGGAGDPVLVLHHEIGSPERLPFYDVLARRFTVYVPSHPGYDGSDRPGWMRNVRDVAVTYQALIAALNLSKVSVVGLGFGGLHRVVLVGAMGIKPAQGEILDEALVSYIAYVRAGFEKQEIFDQVFGAEPPTPLLEQWDLNREMTFRIAWKPYMYNPTLPYLLGGVKTPSLIVWGRRDRIVPLECGEAYARALPQGRLAVIEDAGHFIDMEQPEALAKLVIEFAAQP